MENKIIALDVDGTLVNLTPHFSYRIMREYNKVFKSDDEMWQSKEALKLYQDLDFVYKSAWFVDATVFIERNPNNKYVLITVRPEIHNKVIETVFGNVMGKLPTIYNLYDKVYNPKGLKLTKIDILQIFPEVELFVEDNLNFLWGIQNLTHVKNVYYLMRKENQRNRELATSKLPKVKIIKDFEELINQLGK